MITDKKLAALRTDAEFHESLCKMMDILHGLHAEAEKLNVRNDPEVRQAFQRYVRATQLDILFSPQPGESDEQVIKR